MFLFAISDLGNLAFGLNCAWDNLWDIPGICSATGKEKKRDGIWMQEKKNHFEAPQGRKSRESKRKKKKKWNLQMHTECKGFSSKFLFLLPA